VRYVEEMIKICWVVVKPDGVNSVNGIAAVGSHKGIEEIILPLQSPIETASGKGASHGFNIGIGPVNDIPLTALEAKRNETKGAKDFLWYKAAEVSHHF